ncbi:MAG: peptidylprolyl isomerase [Bacteroidales bacterium]|jgi:peptidyl-prolyl cis-trans isomerase D
MAVIGSIRKHSTFLVIIIGVALAAFVLGDFVKGNGGTRDVNIGVVEGQEITIMDFNAKAEQNIDNKLQQQQTDRLSIDEQFRVKDETYNQMVFGVIMDNEYEDLGLTVTSDELFDMVQGANPHPLIVQYFSDPNTGKFDRNLIIQYLQNMDNMPEQAKQQWYQFEKYIKDDRFRSKFNTLLTKGYYVPTALAQMTFEEENNKADVDYIAATYKSLADSLFVPTTSDYQTYYDAHKENYKQDATRDIKYVVFEVKPSAEDVQMANDEAQQIYKEFVETPDVMRFVKVNSDKNYDSTWYAQGKLPVQIDSIMFNSPVGTVVPPYLENYEFHIARLVAESMRPDSMKANHILIAYQGAYKADQNVTRLKVNAKSLADSLLAVLKKSPKEMKALAVKFSNDPSATTNSGDLGWFADGQMVPAFNEATLVTPVDGFTVAETPFGYHVIEVTGKKPLVKKIRVAMIDREVLPSNETYQGIFAEASKLASENKTLEQFNEYVGTENLNAREMPNLTEMSNRIPGLPNPRQIVQWAFKETTEVGDVSPVFDLEDMFVVAVETKAIDKGYPELDDVKSILEASVVNELKGKHLAKQMAAYNGDMAKAETEMKLSKTNVTPLFFNSRNLKGFGTENQVIGSVFGMTEGKISEPIVGNAGVFMVRLNSLTKAAAPASLDQVINTMQTAFKQSIDQDQAYRALEESLNVVDNRIKFY